jgi:hypothetical protein
MKYKVGMLILRILFRISRTLSHVEVALMQWMYPNVNKFMEDNKGLFQDLAKQEKSENLK